LIANEVVVVEKHVFDFAYEKSHFQVVTGASKRQFQDECMD